MNEWMLKKQQSSYIQYFLPFQAWKDLLKFDTASWNSYTQVSTVQLLCYRVGRLLDCVVWPIQHSNSSYTYPEHIFLYSFQWVREAYYVWLSAITMG